MLGADVLTPGPVAKAITSNHDNHRCDGANMAPLAERLSRDRLRSDPTYCRPARFGRPRLSLSIDMARLLGWADGFRELAAVAGVDYEPAAMVPGEPDTLLQFLAKKMKCDQAL